MINTIILVYFVAGDKVFVIRDVFPHIAFFIIAAVGVGGPLVIFIGWLHYKKAFKSEADIMTRQNPFNTKIMIPTMLALVNYMRKNTTSYSDYQELVKLQKYIEHIEKGGKLDSNWNSDPS
ncbi:MAG: hypothetical protein GTO02_09980 [Candidatus Dadabacteria bacterium]|nr:hypothetical protein [Candidatus Dadabacteria bacterium]